MGLLDSIRRVVGGGQSEDDTGPPDEGGELPELVTVDDFDASAFQTEAVAVANEAEPLDFSIESLEQFDEAIATAYDGPSATSNEPGIYARDTVRFGSYLGEVLVRTYGGEWTNDPDWGVTVTGPRDTATVSVFDVAARSIADEPLFSVVAQRLADDTGVSAGDSHTESETESGPDTSDESSDESTDDPSGDQSIEPTEQDPDDSFGQGASDHADRAPQAADEPPVEQEATEETTPADSDDEQSDEDDLSERTTDSPDPFGTDTDDTSQQVTAEDLFGQSLDDEQADEDDTSGQQTDDTDPFGTDTDDVSEPDAEQTTAQDHFGREPDDQQANEDDTSEQQTDDTDPFRTDTDETPFDGDTDETSQQVTAEDLFGQDHDDEQADEDTPFGDDTDELTGEPTDDTPFGDQIDDGEQSGHDEGDDITELVEEAEPDWNDSATDTSPSSDTDDIDSGQPSGPDTAKPVTDESATQHPAEPETDPTEGDGLRAEYAQHAADFTSFWHEHELDYTVDSLVELDTLVEAEWNDDRFEDATFGEEETFEDKAFTSVVTELGSYFGEVLVRTLDGEWSDETSSDAVVVDSPDGPLAVPVFKIADTSLRETPVFAQSYDALKADITPES